MNTRIVNLPAAYRAQVIPPRHRNPQPAMFRENIAVAIPDLSSEAAPLGVEWVQNSLKTRYEVEGPAPRILTRFHDGRHYGAIQTGGAALSVDEFLADVADPVVRTGGVGKSQWRRSDYPSLPGFYRRGGFYRENALTLTTLSDAGPVGRIASSMRDEDLSECKASLARDLIFVDGTVWSTEIAAEMWWGVHRRPEAVEIMVGYRQEMLSYCSPFRLDREADARAFASIVAEQSGAPLSDTGDQVIIHTPASVVRDDLMMLADQITAGADLSVTNGQNGWPDEISTARNGLLQLRSTDKADRDRAWAGQVIQYAAALRAGLPSVSDLDGLAGDILRGIDLGMLRWELMEKGRHPDIEAVMASEADLASLSL